MFDLLFLVFFTNIFFSANSPPSINGPNNIVVTVDTEAIVHVTAYDNDNDTFKLRAYGLPGNALVTYGNDFVTVRWRVLSSEKVSCVIKVQAAPFR